MSKPTRPSGSSAGDSTGEEEQLGGCYCCKSGESQGHCDSTPHTATPSNVYSPYHVPTEALSLSLTIYRECVWASNSYLPVSCIAPKSSNNPFFQDKDGFKKHKQYVALADLIGRVK
jgi:hypothetical protein